MDDGHANDITFADLEMFLVFSRNEHFGKTASELGLSVATVQRGIRSLERKLGVALIEPAGRRVRMLHSGHVLVREAQGVLRARLDAVDTTRAESGVPHRRLRIAHTYSLGLGFVPDVLAELLRSHPELRFRCWQGPATDVVSALLRGEADVAFTSLSPTETDVVVEPLFTESLLLTVPADDPLAEQGETGRGETGQRETRQAQVGLAEVQDRPFVAMELGSSSRTHMVNACARAGFVPRIAAEGNDLFVVESMVGAGIGVSVVPEGMNNHQHPRVVRLPIRDPSSKGRTIFLAYQRTSAVHESVRTLAGIARTHGRSRGRPLHQPQ